MKAFAVLVVCAAAAIGLPAQTFTTLHSFDSTDGANPIAGLIQAADGNLYGAATNGGAHSDGTVFKIITSGLLTTLHSFDHTDGFFPVAPPLEARDGNFYGTTSGTVFKLTPSGVVTTLHTFGGPDGLSPEGGLIQAKDGNFYGTTNLGGAAGLGTVFKITPTGTLTTLYSFCSQSSCADGARPAAGLLQATDGNFYGTTYGYPDTSTQYGTVFKITSSGTLTTLHSFNSTDGEAPFAALIEVGRSLYGTTYFGGGGSGTIFRITLGGGTLTTLYNFCSQSGCVDGSGPVAGLAYATDGNLYGTTYFGGAHGGGTVFEITPSGALTTLHSFEMLGNPEGVLVQDTNGTLYGTTQIGGARNLGTVFSLSVGLGPFVETQTTSGKVGTKVVILGTNLTGSTSVTFNGTAASFKVVSSSEITASVPTGATTGTVKVVTPGGTLSSNVAFQVR